MGPLEPMNIFLRLEIDRMTKVISTVQADLTDLQLAIDGTIVMNERLKNALDNIYQARVPATWEKVSFLVMFSAFSSVLCIFLISIQDYK